MVFTEEDTAIIKVYLIISCGLWKLMREFLAKDDKRSGWIRFGQPYHKVA